MHNDGSYTTRHGIPQRLTRACASRIRLAAKAIIARRSGVVPAIFAAAGEKAMRRFLEFFAVTIDNKNTRNAYLHACRRFFAWYDRHEDVELLADIEPMHVAAYIQRRRAAKDRKRRRQNPVDRRLSDARAARSARLGPRQEKARSRHPIDLAVPRAAPRGAVQAEGEGFSTRAERLPHLKVLAARRAIRHCIGVPMARSTTTSMPTTTVSTRQARRSGMSATIAPGG